MIFKKKLFFQKHLNLINLNLIVKYNDPNYKVKMKFCQLYDFNF